MPVDRFSEPRRDGSGGHRVRGHAVALVVLVGLVFGGSAAAEPAERPGRYERRQSARGETTDTSARLSTHGFINDRRAAPWRLTLFVDTFPARRPSDETLLPLRVGVARAGGSDLPDILVAPERFVLDAPSLETPRAGLRQAEIVSHPAGRASLSHHARMGRLWPAPVPFGVGDGARIATRFAADPSRTVLLHEETELPPGAWLVDTVYFEVPPSEDGFDRWNELLSLSLLGPDGSPVVTTDFRLQRDPHRLREAFKRARKARAREDEQAEKARRREARRERRRASEPR